MKTFRKIVDEKVQFSIAPTDLCPCGSKTPAYKCCLNSSGFHKPQASIRPLLPKTGKSLVKCYASDLKDCCSKLSREHYVSITLLEYLNRDKDLRIKGLTWPNNLEDKFPPNALASKILCERHNGSLSKLDKIAIGIFTAFDESNTTDSNQQLLHLFSGHDIERWLLKILCGMAYSKNLPTNPNIITTIPYEWLQILFGYEEFSNEKGLYVCKTKGHIFEGPRGLKIGAIEGNGQLSGIGVWICGYELILSMNGFPSRFFDNREVVYRPQEIHSIGKIFEKSIVFSWDGCADLGTIECVTI